MVVLKVFFTVFEKINLGFGFSLRSLLMVFSLGMRSFVCIWISSVSLLNIGQFFENVGGLLRCGCI